MTPSSSSAAKVIFSAPALGRWLRAAVPALPMRVAQRRTMSTPKSAVELPRTCLPTWDVAELPDPPALSWRHWTRFIGPGIVMMGVQIGGGEWLFGPEITARYGGSLMWIATVAIVESPRLEVGQIVIFGALRGPVVNGVVPVGHAPRHPRLVVHQRVARFVDLLYAGEVVESIRSVIFGATLLALKKRDGTHRPIACSLTLRRLRRFCYRRSWST